MTFREYMADRVATLRPTDGSLEIARTLMVPRVGAVPGAALRPLTMVTTELLLTRTRRETGAADLNPVELAWTRGLQLSMRNSAGHLPTDLGMSRLPRLPRMQRTPGRRLRSTAPAHGARRAA